MDRKDWIEEIRVKGCEAVDRVKELVAEGKVRKIVLKKENDQVLFELPLTTGVIASGAVTLLAPLLTALGATVILLNHVKIEIHRSDDEVE